VLPPPISVAPVDLAKIEVHLSEPFSERNFIRNTAPPEFGDGLLRVLNSANPEKPLRGNSEAAIVERGAQLFGIGLVAFANRTVGGAITAGGDGRDDNAINQTDRGLNCVGCHTPIRRDGAVAYRPHSFRRRLGKSQLQMGTDILRPTASPYARHQRRARDEKRSAAGRVVISRASTTSVSKKDGGIATTTGTATTTGA
jgi:hypothetical protein